MGLDAARIRNGRTPAGFRPNGLPLGQQSRCRLGTFEPAKSKGGWMGLDMHASETAEPQQDSGPTGCHWVSRAPAIGSRRAETVPNGLPLGRAGAVWAPSNPLKAKVDGWGWTLWPWVQLPALRTRKKQRWVGGAGRCANPQKAKVGGRGWTLSLFGCSCQRKQRWMGGAGRCRLGCSCQCCCTSFAKAASRWPPCRMNVLSRPSFGFVLPARLPLELRRGVGGFVFQLVRHQAVVN